MKVLLTLALTLFLCAPLFAVDAVDPKIDKAVRDLIPVCADAKIKYEDLTLKVPPRFSGVFVTVDSPSGVCVATYAAVVAPSGALFLGNPWQIGSIEGQSIEEKLKNFSWRMLHENMVATVDRTRNSDGLFPVTLNQSTENGKMPLAGFVDPEGTVFFFGRFRTGTDVRASRAKVFDSFIEHSPAKGADKPAVTIVEFSDFQCPSCQRAAGYVDPIVTKHHDKVRYVRFDLPLSGHTWAFGAALAGRAIYRQNPEVFWEYKKQIYSNQSSLNAFIFWDWARQFAGDHDLDLKRYDADLANADIKTELLSGAGAALSNDVRATPSYLVNGVLVDAGEGGKALAEYVDSLVK